MSAGHASWLASTPCTRRNCRFETADLVACRCRFAPASIVFTISRPWALIENSETVMRRILSAAALAAVLCTSAIASDKGSTPPASTAAVPAGAYTLDKAHASLIFKVNHLGFSNYTARFKRFDAKLQFDPANLPASKLTATVDVKSLETD